MQKLVGNEFGSCVYAFEYTQSNELDYVHIYNLYVHPDFRGQGRAREILNLTIAEIRSTGYKGKIKIVADPDEKGIDRNRLAMFYKSLGLEVFEFYG